jgi:hypothetical protein
MIRYTLRCQDGHVFESWFASAATFDRLAEAGGLSCAVCGADRVEKTLMAPALSGGGRAEDAPAPDTPPPAPERPEPTLSAPASPLEAALRHLRASVEAKAEHVGRDFARRARDMHAGAAEETPIYGEATREEARALLEDDIPVLPLPWPARRDD